MGMEGGDAIAIVGGGGGRRLGFGTSGARGLGFVPTFVVSGLVMDPKWVGPG